MWTSASAASMICLLALWYPRWRCAVKLRGSRAARVVLRVAGVRTGSGACSQEPKGYARGVQPDLRQSACLLVSYSR
jgi:hypothetical protein